MSAERDDLAAVAAVVGYGTSWTPIDASHEARDLCGDLIHQLHAALDDEGSGSREEAGRGER